MAPHGISFSVVNVMVNRFSNCHRCVRFDFASLHFSFLFHPMDHKMRITLGMRVFACGKCQSNDDRNLVHFCGAGAKLCAFNLSYWSNKVYVNRMSNKLTHSCRPFVDFDAYYARLIFPVCTSAHTHAQTRGVCVHWALNEPPNAIWCSRKSQLHIIKSRCEQECR